MKDSLKQTLLKRHPDLDRATVEVEIVSAFRSERAKFIEREKRSRSSSGISNSGESSTGRGFGLANDRRLCAVLTAVSLIAVGGCKHEGWVRKMEQADSTSSKGYMQLYENNRGLFSKVRPSRMFPFLNFKVYKMFSPSAIALLPGEYLLAIQRSTSGRESGLVSATKFQSHCKYVFLYVCVKSDYSQCMFMCCFRKTVDGYSIRTHIQFGRYLVFY